MVYLANILVLNKFNFFYFPLFLRFYALHAHQALCNSIITEGLLFTQNFDKAPCRAPQQNMD